MPYTDAIQPQQPLQRPFAASLLLHGCVTAVILLWGYLYKAPAQFGDKDAGSGPGTVTIETAIRMSSRTGPKNPVANDTESQVEPRSAPREKAAEPDDPDAVALDRNKRPKKDRKKKAAASVPYRPKRDQDLTKLYAERGGRLVDNMYSMKGGGGVGLSPNSVFGQRFGYYADLIRQRLAEKWKTDDINLARNTSALVTVTFEIQRNGNVGGIQVVQSSGNYALDASAQRAIRDASPFPELPAGFERNSAKVEFQFQFKR